MAPTYTFEDYLLRVRIEAVNHGFYPDAQMLCGEPVFWNGQTDVIVNPGVIVEVLSPSTAKIRPRGETRLLATSAFCDRHSSGFTG